MVEKIFVESMGESRAYDYGILISKVIAEYAFTDLALGKAVEQLRILVDIKEPLFAVHARLGPPLPPLRMEDYAQLEENPDGIHVIIRDETYVADMLRVLRERFGREKVKQVDRWETVISVTSLEELKRMVIAEPQTKMVDRLMDAVQRIIPVGFRVGFLEHDENSITLIASENPIREEWIREVKDALKKPPKPIPPEELEKVRRKVEAAEVMPEFKDIVAPWRPG